MKPRYRIYFHSMEGIRPLFRPLNRKAIEWCNVYCFHSYMFKDKITGDLMPVYWI